MAAAAVEDVAVAVTDMYCNDRNRLQLQFHITGRCNLRCKHCYRTEGDVEPLSTENVLSVIDQFAALRRKYNEIHRIKRRGHINITGGEPFIRKDIHKILKHLRSYREDISYGILSNGSFLDADKIALLKETGVSFVQLSIDGNAQTHNALRAPGDYERTFQTARHLEKCGIPTYISFTANRLNYTQLPGVAAACRKYGITKLWTDRLVPIGNGEQLQELVITDEILPDYLNVLRKAQGSWLTRFFYPKTLVVANRALQFLGANGPIYSCSAGSSLITVDEFGQIMPCRRMPVVCGSALEDGLEKVYFDSAFFKALRKNDTPRDCHGCVYSYHCRGGARCQAYAVHGAFLRADPACPQTRKDK